MANNEQKTITISTIPIPKLTLVINNFICNTVNHLNKLSVKGDEKLAEFDKKLNDLEIMTTLLESKLESLPEKITSTYPPKEQIDLDDITPPISSLFPSTNVEVGKESENPVPPPPQTSEKNENEDQKKNENEEQQPTDNKIEGEAEGAELSPKEALDNFLNAHEKYRNISKMLNMGVPTNNIRQKAIMDGFDKNLIEELIELAQKVNPNIK